jgi:hypothetical protein
MPFFAIYLLVWHLVFASYLLHPSFIMDPHEGELVATIYGMAGTMLVGYAGASWIARKMARRAGQKADAVYALDLIQVYKFQMVIAFIVVAIFAAAVALRGAPPGLGSIFSLASKSYLDYGAGFVGQIQPLLNVLFLTTGLIERRGFRWSLRLFAILIFLLLAQRGPMIMMLLQYGALVAFRNAKHWRSFRFTWRFLLVAVLICATLIEFMDLGQQLRGTAVSSAMKYLRVAQASKHWPLGFLLLSLYLDLPPSNFIWMLDQNLGGAAGFWAVAQAVPSVFRGDNPLPDYMIPGTVDGASTYLAPMFLAYGWTGLIVEHLVLGAMCYAISRPNVLRDKPLFAAVLSCQIFVACFADSFLNLGYIAEYVLIFIFYKLCSQTLVSRTHIAAGPRQSATPLSAE